MAKHTCGARPRIFCLEPETGVQRNEQQIRQTALGVRITRNEEFDRNLPRAPPSPREWRVRRAGHRSRHSLSSSGRHRNSDRSARVCRRRHRAFVGWPAHRAKVRSPSLCLRTEATSIPELPSRIAVELVGYVPDLPATRVAGFGSPEKRRCTRNLPSACIWKR